MPKKRNQDTSLRKVREILRLGLESQLGHREIAKSCSVSRSTVSKILSSASQKDLNWSKIKDYDDDKLNNVLNHQKSSSISSDKPQPDWKYIHQELKKKNVTLHLLWEEYKAIHPDGYQPTQFYEHYSRWRKKLNVSLRQNHKAGEKIFVDYAGQTLTICNSKNNKTREAQIFVAVLGSSNYTYAEATWTQGLPDWIMSHVRAFEFYGGVSEIVVPDNLRSGVSKSCRYEPDINPSYHEMAVHYSVVIIPTRVRKPKDKAKVEVGVQIVERWILAALRNRRFFSLREANEAIWELLERLNSRPFKKLEGSRREWFEKFDKPALRPLPESRYVFCQWKKATVSIDYHIALDGHYYSVPFRFLHEKVDLRYTDNTVEIFHKGKRIASHVRDFRRGYHSTCKDHMPKSHQDYLDWSPSRIIQWAKTFGSATAEVIETILSDRPHPEQGYRSCMGIMRLAKQYSKPRLEAACRRALITRCCRFKSIKTILEKGLDKVPISEQQDSNPIDHSNIRGSSYYQINND